MNDAHDNAATDRDMLANFKSKPCALCGHPRMDHGISFAPAHRTTKCYTEVHHECAKCQVGQTKPFGPGCDCEEVMCDCPGFEDAPEEPPADGDDRDPYEGEVLLW